MVRLLCASLLLIKVFCSTYARTCIYIHIYVYTRNVTVTATAHVCVLVRNAQTKNDNQVSLYCSQPYCVAAINAVPVESWAAVRIHSALTLPTWTGSQAYPPYHVPAAGVAKWSRAAVPMRSMVGTTPAYPIKMILIFFPVFHMQTTIWPYSACACSADPTTIWIGARTQSTIIRKSLCASARVICATAATPVGGSRFPCCLWPYWHVQFSIECICICNV